jgi:hypothetical protein
MLPVRRAQVTHKVRVGHRRTLYLSTHDARPPLELFVRVKGHDCTAETIALYDCLAQLVSLALQHGAPMQTVGALLRGVQVEPAGIVTGHSTTHFCSSLPDAIGQHGLSLIPDASPIIPKEYGPMTHSTPDLTPSSVRTPFLVPSCPMCGVPLRGRQTIYSAKCRIARSRETGGTKQRDRDAKIRLLLTTAIGAATEAKELLGLKHRHNETSL